MKQVLTLSLALALLGSAIHAQSPNATVAGRVLDPTSAAMANAKIEIVNLRTGVRHTSQTNNEGAFVVPNLPPGPYRIEVSKDGFKSVVREDVVLRVQDIIALNFTLPIGSVAESVTVTGGTPLVNTQSATVSTVVDRQFVENLPLNGRSFQSLITLSPGVVLTKADFNEPGQFSVNGQRADANYVTVDGVSANIGAPTGGVPGQNASGSLPGFTTFGGTNNLVSVDALQEFRIQTSTYAAEFGRTPGAQVSLVTRAGTNQFHGSLFEYLRNDVFDANDWFANNRGLRRPPLRQNNFGGVFGGPIIKNHTFFFFSYEGLRLRQPLVGITDVPSRAARSNPAISASVRELLNVYPVPTGPDNPNGFAEFAASFSNPTTLNAASLRIDHTFKNRLTVFARYNHAPSETVTRAGDGLRSLNTSRALRVTTRTATLGAVVPLGTRADNDLRVNYSRNSNGGFFDIDDFGGGTPPSNSLLFPAFGNPATDLMNVDISGGRNSSLFIGNATTNIQRQINAIDNVSWVVGSHQLKFGADYRRLYPRLHNRPFAQFITFNGMTNPTNGALSGTAQRVQVESNASPVVPIFTNLSLYGQDTWRVGSRLSLTYGLRWEVNPAPHEASGHDTYAITALTAPNSLAFAPRGTQLWETTYKNFAPRIGGAYQISTRQAREMVLRGGVGLFYDLGTGVVSNSYVSEWPFRSLRTTTNVPFPIPTANSTPAAISTVPPTTSTKTIFDPELQLPYTVQWNVSVEQALGTQTFTASYIGAVGRRLLRQELIRFGSTTFQNPNFGSSASLTTNSATSDYQALQLQFRRWATRGLQTMVSYTWAHSIDSASNDSFTENTPQVLNDVGNDRSASDFDVRHTLTGALSYDIPVWSQNSFVKAALGGWGVDAMLNARSSTPLNVTVASITTNFGFYRFRPNVVPGAPFYIDDPTAGGGRRINPAAFSVPASGQNGNLGRNALRGFAFWQPDVALRRTFDLKEHVKFQLRVEAFNLFNHPNFGDPAFNDLNLGFSIPPAFSPNTAFGRSTSMLGRRLGAGGNSGGFNPLYQVGGPRSLQLSLRVSF